MLGRNPRRLLMLVALYDLVGQLLVLFALVANSTRLTLPIFGEKLSFPIGWVLLCICVYPALGWLFGTYSVMRWTRVPNRVLIQRVGLTAMVSLLVIVLIRWLFNVDEIVWLLHRRVQLLWLTGIFLWSSFIRIVIRSNLARPVFGHLVLLAEEQEAEEIERTWKMIPHQAQLIRVQEDQLEAWLRRAKGYNQITLGTKWHNLESHSHLIRQLYGLDPRRFQLLSPIGLFERQQERLPPRLLRDGWITYDEIPWAQAFAFQAQLKRAIDVILALFLLILTLPLLLITMAFVWIDDPGPIFYCQKRTGWMGSTFSVLKLRTMFVQPSDIDASWTQPADRRITRAGNFLRKMRIDELPQLINILKGDMSLVGPRPERPEMEEALERNIPHYRMRHWMRPGLSGWAQVCAPYASSIDDSHLKLSYDLYYLKRFNLWLDIIIMIRTVKTILKASGR